MQSNKLGASSEAAGGQLQLNRKGIKHKLLLNENPYSQKKDSDSGAKAQVTNEQTSTKQSLNDSFLTNNQFKINRNYSSLNSARDTTNQGQIEKLNLLMQQNEDLQKKVSQLNEELTTRKGLEKELADARASLMDISAVHSQCLEKSRVHDKDNKSVELLTKEIEDLKKQAQLKKAKYTENLQFAKSRMDILKD